MIAGLPPPAQVVVEHLRATGKVSTLGLWGRSMGAVTALLYSNRDPSIAGIVSKAGPVLSAGLMVMSMALSPPTMPTAPSLMQHASCQYTSPLPPHLLGCDSRSGVAHSEPFERCSACLGAGSLHHFTATPLSFTPRLWTVPLAS